MHCIAQLEQTRGGRLTLVLALTVLWWACAVGVTVVLKAALGTAGAEGGSPQAHRLWTFPYPLTLTLFANIGTAAVTGIFAAAVNGCEGCVRMSPETSVPPIMRIASREVMPILAGLVGEQDESDHESAEGRETSAVVGPESPSNGSPRGHPTRGSFFACCGTRRRHHPGASTPGSSMPLGQVAQDLQVYAEDGQEEPASRVGKVRETLRACLQGARERAAWILEGRRATIILIGVLQGLALGVKNEALMLLSVSTRTMIFATNVLVVMLVARLFQLEVLKQVKVIAALLLAVGGMLQGIDTWQHMSRGGSSRSDDPAGCALALLALVLDALRWVMLQAVFTSPELTEPHSPIRRRQLGNGSPMARGSPTNSRLAAVPTHHLSKFSMVSWVMWMSTPVNLCLSLVFEPEGLAKATRDPGPLAGLVGLMTLGVIGINVAEFGVVQWTSAVTFNVLSQLHSIPMVLAGVLCFGDEVALVQVLGFAVCLSGALLYSWARAREEQMPELLKEQDERREPESFAGEPTSVVVGGGGSEGAGSGGLSMASAEDVAAVQGS